MARVHSFEPVIGRTPRVLILGSIPSVVSLQFVQYYANPRNAFWPIMADLFGIDIDCDYPARIQQVAMLPIALWDTIKACHREGSLDSSIQKDQLEANDIPALLKEHSQIGLLAFNGIAAEKYFNQLVKPVLSAGRELEFMRLPSTSPANARMSFAQKLASWRQLLNYLAGM
ncbi:MAG: DNA-deoxyinosine glycosylase [Gammaproteobacteria bacterium]|nr:DNA-deoxyinosine glycosylase [Gammaproteobacteria bacterium]